MFRNPVAAIAIQESQILEWIKEKTKAGYVIQGVIQNTDVVTTYAAAHADWEDTAYITTTVLATYVGS